MRKKIAIIAEHDNGSLKPVTYELLEAAQKIRAYEACDILFFILGEDIKKSGQQICDETGIDTCAVLIPGLLHYNGEIVKKTLLDLFRQDSFDYIIASHSTSGMDYAPAVSVGLKGSCIACVEEITGKNGKSVFHRSMLGGKITAALVPGSFPLVMTIQPGSFRPGPRPGPCGSGSPGEDVNRAGHLEQIRYECREDKMLFKGSLPGAATNSDLAGADVVVSGGRGIREQDNYKYIRMLAALFPRSATGGSRPICDYGWIPYGKQVGMTGTTVSPKLYFACGISGASQHVEAIRDSKFIIALNDDPDALIFRIADVCIVEDLVKFIPLVKEKLEKRKEKNSPAHG